MEKVKLCKDCKHYYNNSDTSQPYLTFGLSQADVIWHICDCPELLCPVTGNGVDAFDMRKQKCGKEGRYWEPKEREIDRTNAK